MLDPVSLAAVSSALTYLGTEVAKSAADEAGKSAWDRITTLLGWKSDTRADEIPQRLQSLSPEDLAQIAQILKTVPDERITQLVGVVHAKNVGVVETNTGTMNIGS